MCPLLCVTLLIHMCDMTHSYVWHDSFICVTWTYESRLALDYVCGASFVRVRVHVRVHVCVPVLVPVPVPVPVSACACACVCACASRLLNMLHSGNLLCCIHHMWKSHVSHVNASYHIHEWVSCVTNINEACHTYEWVLSHVTHIWMSFESCHTYKWVLSHVTHVNEFWVMAHTSVYPLHNESRHTQLFQKRICVWHDFARRQPTHMNESCHTYEWVLSHMWMSHVTHTCIHFAQRQPRAPSLVRTARKSPWNKAGVEPVQ